MNNDWQPGDPLFRPCIWREQPMLGVKDDSTYSSAGARWSPETGWYNPNEIRCHPNEIDEYPT
jgi:hypothetical protein